MICLNLKEAPTCRWMNRYTEAALAFALIIVGTIRIVSTYRVFSQTYDEPGHIACGVEWLDRGTFTTDLSNPPLAKILVAVGPFLRGARCSGMGLEKEGLEILYGNGDYKATLASARAGNLPFFWIGSLVVWFWGRQLHGAMAALAALLLFTNLPPILGHAGLATTDLAVAALFPCAAWVFTRWLDEPDLRNSILLSLFFALALASKFSALPFSVASVAAVLAIRWLALRGHTSRPWLVWFKATMIFAALSIFIILAFYRFSSGSLAEAKTVKETLRSTSNPWVHYLANLRFPGSNFVQGVGEVAVHARVGHESFLLGELRRTGWWFFYPIALGVKTPLGFLILSALGILASADCYWRERQWCTLVPGVCALAILLVCMPCKIDLGVRYILAVYPFLAVVAGGAVAGLWSRRGFSRFLAVSLIAWSVVSSAACHPDYLSYFNALAGPHPEHVLAECDLDWGQDVNRLSAKLSELGVRRFSFAYFGVIDPRRQNLPPCDLIVRGRPASGWVAISIHELMFSPQNYSWLRDREPVCRIGHSINLYYIAPDSEDGNES